MKGIVQFGCVCAAIAITACATKYEVYQVPYEKPAVSVPKGTHHPREGNRSLKPADAPSVVRDTRGIYYSLPKTIVVMDVPIKKTFTKAGRFAPFAKELLDLEVAQSNKLAISVGAPTMSTMATPDPNNTYVLKLKGGWSETRELLAKLTEDGFMTQGTASVEESGFDLTVETFQVAASIASSALYPGAASATQSLASRTAAGERACASDAEVRKIETKLNELRVLKIVPEEFDKILMKLETVHPQKVIQEIEKKRLTWDCVLTEGDSRADESDLLQRCLTRPKSMDDGHYVEGLSLLVPITESKAINALASKPHARKVKEDVQSLLRTNTKVALRSSTSDQTRPLGSVLALIDAIEDHCPPPPPAPPGGTPPPTPKLEGELAQLRSTLEEAGYTQTSGGAVLLSSTDTKAVFGNLNYEQAKRKAESILSLREARTKLVVGQSNAYGTSDGVIDKMIAEIDSTQEELLSNFVGVTKELTWNARFAFQPMDIDPECMTQFQICQQIAELFKYSPTSGVTLSDTFSKPLRLLNMNEGQAGGFILENLPEGGSRYAVSFILSRMPEQMPDSVARSTSKPDSQRAQGFYYRIPATATVKLFADDVTTRPADTDYWKTEPSRLLSQADVRVAQFGVVRALPTSSGSIKKSTFDVLFYTDTGAIQQVTVSGSALETGKITSAGNVVTGVQDARTANRDARQAKRDAEAQAAALAADEITVLTRERDIEQLRKEINDLRNPIPDTGADIEEEPEN